MLNPPNYELAVHIKPELKVHARACDIEPMVQIEEIRAAFVVRLKQSLAAHGIDQWGAGARLAEIAKVTPKASSKWLNGESLPGPAKMRAIADALKVKIEWLQYGSGDKPGLHTPPQEGDSADDSSTSVDIVQQMLAKHGSNLSEDARQKIADAVQETAAEVRSSSAVSAEYRGLRARPDEILIPQYDIRAAMGHGQLPPDYNEAIRNLIVREDVLREKGVTYTSTHALAVITGWGQSMEGTINDNDPVIVDRGVNEFIGDGIYVVTWHDHLYIKRLQVLDAERFWLISDNEKHKDQEARMDDVTIHAKVLLIWNARKA